MTNQDVKKLVMDMYTGEKSKFTEVCQEIFDKFLEDISMNEVYNQGWKKAFSNWLKGLPEDINVCCYFYEIEAVYKKYGIKYDAKEDIFESYYDAITSMVLENSK